MNRWTRVLEIGMLGSFAVGALPARAASQDRSSVASSMEVLFENDFVRVQWHNVEVGEVVPMHSHPPAVVMALANSSVTFTFPSGATRQAKASAGGVYWNDASSHAVSNTGSAPVHNLMMELKRSPAGSQVDTWSEDLLPLAAAPEQHRVVLDNDHVRVLEVVSQPGGIAPVHVHRWPSVFVTLSPAALLFRDQGGDVVFEQPGLVDGEVLPRVQWFGPSTAARSVENADSVALRAYRIEIKDGPSN